MLQFFSFVWIALLTTPVFAKDFGKWHTTHSVEQFPCMNEAETKFLERLTKMQKIEEKKQLLVDHRKLVQQKRSPASVSAQSLTKHRYICPPYKGVRNPYPQVFEFGKAATFERISFTGQHMHILNGLSRNEKWPLQFNAQKGFFEGQTPRGTPTNFIPLSSEKNGTPRFLVQYLIWQDKTPPSLTLCYREDLHQQCNPYKDPSEKATAQTQGLQNRAPASAKP